MRPVRISVCIMNQTSLRVMSLDEVRQMKDGRVVVITGAGGGIGRKIVDRFLANGDRVIGLDRAKSSLEELAASRNAGDQLSTSCVDITDKSAVDAFAKRVGQTYGHVDVLVNCAGFFPVVPFEQISSR